jgi:hypothetical protein
MLRRVTLVRTDVSEEPSVSFIRVTRIVELGTTLAAASNWRTLRRNTSHGVTSQTTPFFIVTAVKTSNLTSAHLLRSEYLDSLVVKQVHSYWRVNIWTVWLWSKCTFTEEWISVQSGFEASVHLLKSEYLDSLVVKQVYIYWSVNICTVWLWSKCAFAEEWISGQSGCDASAHLLKSEYLYTLVVKQVHICWRVNIWTVRLWRKCALTECLSGHSSCKSVTQLLTSEMLDNLVAR